MLSRSTVNLQKMSRGEIVALIEEFGQGQLRDQFDRETDKTNVLIQTQQRLLETIKKQQLTPFASQREYTLENRNAKNDIDDIKEGSQMFVVAYASPKTSTPDPIACLWKFRVEGPETKDQHLYHRYPNGSVMRSSFTCFDANRKNASEEAKTMQSKAESIVDRNGLLTVTDGHACAFIDQNTIYENF